MRLAITVQSQEALRCVNSRHVRAIIKTVQLERQHCCKHNQLSAQTSQGHSTQTQFHSDNDDKSSLHH